MAIYPQRLTIYLYSAHRAVIFAIAQLSCNPYGFGNVPLVCFPIEACHCQFGTRNISKYPVPAVTKSWVPLAVTCICVGSSWCATCSWTSSACYKLFSKRPTGDQGSATITGRSQFLVFSSTSLCQSLPAGTTPSLPSPSPLSSTNTSSTKGKCLTVKRI